MIMKIVLETRPFIVNGFVGIEGIYFQKNISSWHGENYDLLPWTLSGFRVSSVLSLEIKPSVLSA